MQALKANQPEGWVIATCDFAENFLCKFQDEPQSPQWSYRQVTVYPVDIHFRCLEAGCHQLRCDCLVFLSDDLNHDSDASQAFVQHVVAYLSTVQHFEKVVLRLVHGGSLHNSNWDFHFCTCLTHRLPVAVTWRLKRCSLVPGMARMTVSVWCGGAVMVSHFSQERRDM